jgi:hypothetical protein
MRLFKRTNTLVMALSTAALTMMACGQGQAPSPIGPSGVLGPSVMPSPPAIGSATISGTVNAGSRAQRVVPTGSSSTGITVTVVGTNLSATVDFFGRFVLQGVPTGSVQLHFSGAGVDTTINMGRVRDREQIDIELTVKASTVTVESSIRIEDDNSTEIEGPVTNVSGTCPNLFVTVHGWTVDVSSSGPSCDGVKVGIRIRIVGNRTSVDVVAVVRLKVNTPPPHHAPAPGDDDDDDD